MSELFVNFVNMSISASWFILAVLMFRLLLKKAPKWINVLLWGVVAVRLVCPFSFESALSLIPSSQTINPEVAINQPVIDSGVAVIDNVINPIISEATVSFQPEKDVNLFQFVFPYLAGVWLIGIAAMLIYTLVSFLGLKRKIGTAVLLRDNIYQSESVASPFVLGIIRPKIYLPFNIDGKDLNYVVSHENAHIHRKDHLWKPVGFLILTLHWFNPLVWLGYILLCRDIELACDEKVVKELDREGRADYSQALLSCSVNRRMIAACPIAFGEVGVKQRIKSVLNYRRPAFWVIAVAVIVSITVAVCFLTNPVNSTIYNSRYETGKCLYSYVVSADKETKSNELVFDITPDGKVYKTFGDGTTDELGVLKESDYTAEDLETAIKNHDEKLNIGSIKNAYEVSDCIFLQKSNGSVYLVQFFSDGGIMSVFKLNRIIQNGGNNQIDGVDDITEFNFNMNDIVLSAHTYTVYEGTDVTDNYFVAKSDQVFSYNEITSFLNSLNLGKLADGVVDHMHEPQFSGAIKIQSDKHDPVTILFHDGFQKMYMYKGTEKYTVRSNDYAVLNVGAAKEFFEQNPYKNNSLVWEYNLLSSAIGYAEMHLYVDEMYEVAGYKVSDGTANEIASEADENSLYGIAWRPDLQTDENVEITISTIYKNRKVNFDITLTKVGVNGFSTYYYVSPNDSVIAKFDNNYEFVFSKPLSLDDKEYMSESYWNFAPYAGATFWYVTEYILPDGYEIISAKATEGSAWIDDRYYNTDGSKSVKWSPGFYEDGTATKEAELKIEAVKGAKAVEFRVKITEDYEHSSDSDIALKTYKITPINCKMKQDSVAVYYLEEK